MTRYYFVPGMLHPYWILNETKDYPRPGMTTTFATNAEADTDMGMLSADEFYEMFPSAYEITKQQYLEWIAG